MRRKPATCVSRSLLLKRYLHHVIFSLREKWTQGDLNPRKTCCRVYRSIPPRTEKNYYYRAMTSLPKQASAPSASLAQHRFRIYSLGE